jgi:photosystem II stability/assembly factor-like uncharacterized protein
MEADFDSTSTRARAQRALALIAVSLVAIAGAGILYLHPSWPGFASSSVTGPAAPQTAYRVGAIDFIDPATGWVAALLGSGDVAVLHTHDGARTWVRQLVAEAGVHLPYLEFFDRRVGLLAFLGGPPLLYRTTDGGTTWTALRALTPWTSVLSWSFVDSDHGWMLARSAGETPQAPPRLYRTQDGGGSWEDLGQPVAVPEQAYQVHFSPLTTGWLATSGPAPNAYRSRDLGVTWTRVPLPAPRGAWPGPGQFFVGVQPTLGAGAIASVVFVPPIRGRSGVGGSIRGFPPLTVRAYDGGRLNTYLYATVLDRVVVGGRTGAQPPNETVLSTLDNGVSWVPISKPPPSGAIGYSDAANWWWIGSGSWAMSADAGVTWTDPRTIGAGEPLPGSLQLLDSAHAWFAASGTKPALEVTNDAGRHWRVAELPPIVLAP